MLTLRIWDLPTRLFHWALAACVVGLIITGKWGGQAMVWHFRFGFAVLALLIFRLIWGFVGGHWSRWSQLPLGPRAVIAHLQGAASAATAGHNPLGSWSIVAMLLVLLLQVSTGLVSDDEIAMVGPLAFMVPGHWVSWATSWHKQWGQWSVLFLVLLHLLALVWHRYRHRAALVPAMLHGNKTLSEPHAESLDGGFQRSKGAFLFAMACLVVWALVSLGS